MAIAVEITLVALIPLIALWMDRQWGEPRRYHPLVLFGNAASWFERVCYGDDSLSHLARELRGMFAVVVLLLPPVAMCFVLASLPYVGVLFALICLYLCLGMESLDQHAQAVKLPLLNADLLSAKQAVAMIVSRETGSMNAEQVTSATIESVLENGNDAVFATLFWFFVLGAPGAVLLRLTNTLDAMWGYRTERYNHFGRCAARLDDALNWIPARLTAITFAMLGQFTAAMQCWREQACCCASPNGGPVMTAGAGSLGVLLGGPATYHGVVCDKPVFGAGRSPQAADIDRAVLLVKRGAWCWVVLYAAIQVIYHA